MILLELSVPRKKIEYKTTTIYCQVYYVNYLEGMVTDEKNKIVSVMIVNIDGYYRKKNISGRRASSTL